MSIQCTDGAQDKQLDMTGLIFHIQRFSVNDGPGIRTTVFFKGCPLRCVWCHNPESISFQKEIVFREDRCIRCGGCVEVCEHEAARQVGHQIVYSRENCARCGRCVEVCYTEARNTGGREVTTEEVVEEVIKDAVFYDQSGGGVTFSGGEPLLQDEFLLSLLHACSGRNIHTAVDTSGYVAPGCLKRISEAVDLFLYDIKTVDDSMHREFTGVSNTVILENLRLLAEWNKNVIVRIPVIPHVNDDEENMERIGEFVSSLEHVPEIHLLPYHETGVEKYYRLGLTYPLKEAVPPAQGKIDQMVEALRHYVERVSVGG